ncbi:MULTISPECIES: helix-turn-helix domain-containing protein [unclassified Streptomyces]|uniref:helix-turn-helix domain-containing protein n=1 Tax=unclassified Streptomyces TaxID=2593676 RepID=UPI00382EE1D5
MAWKRIPTPQSVYRRQLALRLRELRDESGLTLNEVAARIEVHQGSLSRLENGDRGTTPVMVNAMLDVYGVDDSAVRDDILDLVRADRARSKPWWKKYSAVLSPTRYDGYLTLEASALSLCSYQPLLVPGLLQTPAYAEAVISGMGLGLTPRQVTSLVDVRVRRQEERLGGENPVKLWAIIEETALLRQVGSPEIMRDQLKRLLDIEETPHITVQLVPLTVGAHPGLYGPFVVMSFPEPASDLVWLENPQNSIYLENPEDVDAYGDSFDHLRALALGPPETRTRIEQMIKELPK